MPEVREILGAGALLTVLAAACGGRLADAYDAGCPPSPATDDGGSSTAPASPAPLRDGGDPDAVDGDAQVDAAVRDAGTSCPRFAMSVTDYAFGPGQSHNQTSRFPEAIFGPPFAGSAGSVVSLGNGGHVVVSFGGTAIVDGPGVDFIVFENPLPGFAELATVAVSDDGVTWTEFPCTWQPGDDDYGACAGVTPVRSSPLNGIDPTDPRVSGGDGFDLYDIGVARARFVRITDRVDLDGVDGVFDLDAVAIVNAECP